GGAIAVIGAVYYIATFSIQETANIVTPRTFPAIVGIALIVLGLFLAGQAVYSARKAALAEARSGDHINGTGAGNGAAASAGESAASAGKSAASAGKSAASAGKSAASAGKSAASDETAGGPSLETPPEPAARKVVFQFALFFVYLAILIPVGFLLSTAAFLMGLTSIYSPQKWIRNLIFSIGFALVVYLAFVYGLAVYLPVGILG